MKQELASFIAGLIFALGLGLSGMTQPQKVIGFLDLANWDPSLAFVMAGAIFVHAPLYKLIRKRASPLLDKNWHIPARGDVTPRLLIGSAIFGAGWGLAGYCPGPAITALASGQARSLAFVVSMLMGIFIYRLSNRRQPLQE